MNKLELTKVFTKIQIGDNRQAGTVVLAEWFDSIGDLDFDDAIAAVIMFRRESKEYLVPAHIRENVRRIKEERAQHKAIEDPSIDDNRIRPRPANEAAMTAAWNNPDEFARQVEIYHQQLRDAGFDPLEDAA
jgi:hypothetical protein